MNRYLYCGLSSQTWFSFSLGLALTFFLSTSSALSSDEKKTKPLPWENKRGGERLIYEIHWGMFHAAELQLVTKPVELEKTSDQGEVSEKGWRFHATVKTRGVPESIYPIRSSMSSLTLLGPWRSQKFLAKRDENGRKKKEWTVVNYTSGGALFQDLRNKTEEPFKVPSKLPDQRFEDLVSMIYGVRMHDWYRSKRREVVAVERHEIKRGTVKREAIEDRKVGKWGKRKVFNLYALEKKTSKREPMKCRVFMTTDGKRLPLRADLNFAYGTFALRLKKVDQGAFKIPDLPKPPPEAPSTNDEVEKVTAESVTQASVRDRSQELKKTSKPE